MYFSFLQQERLAAAYYREGEHSSHELRLLFDEDNIPPPNIDGNSIIVISSDNEINDQSVEIVNAPNSPPGYNTSSLSYESLSSSLNTDDAFWNEHAWMDQSSRGSSSRRTHDHDPSPAQSTNSPSQPGQSRPPLSSSEGGRHRSRTGVGSSSIASWSPFRKF